MSRRKNSPEPGARSPEMLSVWAEVNLDHLRHNLRALRSLAKPSGAGILAIVKADAYGHGMAAVTRVLYKEGVRFFGVASLDEALRLRGSCRGAQVLVLGSFHAGQVARYVREKIRPTLSSLEDLLVLEKGLSRARLSRRMAGRYPVHVKVDTGMGRLGVWHGDALQLFDRIRQSRRVRLEGVYTHFSSADEADVFFTKLQMHRFENSTVSCRLRSQLLTTLISKSLSA